MDDKVIMVVLLPVGLGILSLAIGLAVALVKRYIPDGIKHNPFFRHWFFTSTEILRAKETNSRLRRAGRIVRHLEPGDRED